jgi:hypothetical protein
MLKLFSPSLLDRRQAYIDLVSHAEVQKIERRYATLRRKLLGTERGDTMITHLENVGTGGGHTSGRNKNR